MLSLNPYATSTRPGAKVQARSIYGAEPPNKSTKTRREADVVEVPAKKRLVSPRGMGLASVKNELKEIEQESSDVKWKTLFDDSDDEESDWTVAMTKWSQGSVQRADADLTKMQQCYPDKKQVHIFTLQQLVNATPKEV